MVFSSDKHKCLMAQTSKTNSKSIITSLSGKKNIYWNCLFIILGCKKHLAVVVPLKAGGRNFSKYIIYMQSCRNWEPGKKFSTITYPHRVICGCVLRSLNPAPSNMASEQSSSEGVLFLTAPPRALEYINHCGPQGCWEQLLTPAMWHPR